MIFLHGVLQPTLKAGAQNKAEDACGEGYHGNTDFWGGDFVGPIPGNRDFFPVEYGQKD